MTEAVMRSALALHRAGQLDEAARLYEQVVAAQPRNPDALYLLGTVHFQRGEVDTALARFDRALKARPDFPEAQAARGAALSQLERHAEALAAYDKLLAVRPNQPETWNNRANALLVLGRAADAVASYDRALALKADYADGWRNRGIALMQLGRPADALQSFDRALRLRPDSADTWEDSASALAQLDRREDAIAAYDRALGLKPRNPNLLYNRGNNHSILKHYENAIHDCEAVLALVPDYPYARGVLLHSKLQSCDWHAIAEHKVKIERDLCDGKRVCSPFNWKAVSDSPAEHRRCAELWVAHECPPFPKPLAQSTRYEHDRIRLAYISADFNNTAVASLMAGVFERHDRTRFETFAISFGNPQPSPMRRRLESAFEHFIDVRNKSDREIAALVRSLEVDIAVDLMGFTGECRPAIFAQRPAPLQVNYLGFPGTMGAPYIDYIIADPTVIPAEHQAHFAEKIAYLAHCYLPADRVRTIAERPKRAEAGLPEQGFVFASFNNSYKFNPALFDIWIRLLRDVEESVLWLPENNPSTRRNLAREAQTRGIAPERIVFAPPVPGAEPHLARLSLTDLFLDTHPYNAHTTAVDALWAGVPIVTLLGGSFASRVAASALKAAGLPELVADSPVEYESLALELARNAAKLAGLRAKLASNRLNCALFDTAQFTHDLEALFVAMWERHQRGEPAAGFAVADVA